MKVAIEIISCKNCPYFKIGNVWSSDGFDRMEDWECTIAKKTIAASVEWHEEKDIKIPEWCPAKVDQ